MVAFIDSFVAISLAPVGVGKEDVEDVVSETVVVFVWLIWEGRVDERDSGYEMLESSAVMAAAAAAADAPAMIVSSLYVGGNWIGCSWKKAKGEPSVLLSTDSWSYSNRVCTYDAMYLILAFSHVSIYPLRTL